jgi:NAD(P)-dependent dehydrogenase (short-subunit alcohol dehydrogenase family)
MINPMNLEGKSILVVGASSGIGADTAKLINQLGAKTILIARREAEMQALLSEMQGENDYISFDVSNLDRIEETVKTLVEKHGSLDGMVYAAGIGSTRPLKMINSNYLHEVMQVNFYPFVEFVRCITKKRMFNEGLSIVGVSSVSSMQGNQGKTAYCASKAAMDSAMRCMAKEFAGKKVRVNTVAPALIKTYLFDRFLSNSDGSKDAESILLRQYMGVGETSDVANMVCYLLSDAARFITGSTVALDGGRLSS